MSEIIWALGAILIVFSIGLGEWIELERRYQTWPKFKLVHDTRTGLTWVEDGL